MVLFGRACVVVLAGVAAGGIGPCIACRGIEASVSGRLTAFASRAHVGALREDHLVALLDEGCALSVEQDLVDVAANPIGRSLQGGHLGEGKGGAAVFVSGDGQVEGADSRSSHHGGVTQGQETPPLQVGSFQFARPSSNPGFARPLWGCCPGTSAAARRKALVDEVRHSA